MVARDHVPELYACHIKTSVLHCSHLLLAFYWNMSSGAEKTKELVLIILTICDKHCNSIPTDCLLFQVYDASIAIPTDILTQIRCASAVCPQNDTIRIQTVLYRNAQLFPADDNFSQYQVTSGVIASKIGKICSQNESRYHTMYLLLFPVVWSMVANVFRH